MNNFWFDAVQRYYGLGIYTIENVRIFVEAGRITKEQFKEITGEDFDPVKEDAPQTIPEKGEEVTPVEDKEKVTETTPKN